MKDTSSFAFFFVENGRTGRDNLIETTLEGSLTLTISMFEVDPKKDAIVMTATGKRATFGEVDQASHNLAGHLYEMGLRMRGSIAILMKNSIEMLEVAWAGQRSGLYYTAISTRLLEDEVAYIIDDCGASVIFYSAELAELANKALTRIDRKIVKVEALADGYSLDEGAIELNTLFSESSTVVYDQVEGADMLYSSGTTGRPKGIKWNLSGKPFLSEATKLVALASALYGFSPETRYLSPAPLYHAAPLRYNLTTNRMGGTTYIMDHFDPEDFLLQVEKYKINTTQMVPTMFVRLLKLDKAVRAKYDPSSIKYAIHAAAPCPIPIKQAMIDWWGPVIYEYYAGTEGNGFVACTSEEWLTHKGSVGRSLHGEIKILNEEHQEVPTGQDGKVYFANGGRFTYHNDEAKTSEAHTKDGWSTIGDIGHLDQDGFLYLTDRASYVIISGGVNIYPQEAENILISHSKVADAAVIGVPNEDFGEEVKGVVELLDPKDASPELERELIEFCRSQLAPIKCPRSIDFRPSLPRQPTGKLYKRLLKDEYWANYKARI
ncbi:MAG: acyl-CoA synthetase [Actinomycetota bacterium]|nr:acyl-CoA synthetase [Actinomycetota bacterium]